jgi:hypothetical protein
METMRKNQDKPNGKIHMLSRDEARSMFDRQAHRYANMSGDEFIRAWDAGEFDDRVEQSDVQRVAMLLPLGR